MSDLIPASYPSAVSGDAPKDHGTGRACSRCPEQLNRYNSSGLCRTCSLELERAAEALTREYAYTFLGPRSFRGSAAQEISLDFAHRALLRLARPSTGKGQQAGTPRYVGGAALLSRATGMPLYRATTLMDTLERRGLLERTGTHRKAPLLIRKDHKEPRP